MTTSSSVTSSIVTAAAASVAAAVNATTSTTAGPQVAAIVTGTPEPPADVMFLQTKTAQVLAGLFVWAALFLTCQQVRTNIDKETCLLQFRAIFFF